MLIESGKQVMNFVLMVDSSRLDTCRQRLGIDSGWFNHNLIFVGGWVACLNLNVFKNRIFACGCLNRPYAIIKRRRVTTTRSTRGTAPATRRLLRQPPLGWRPPPPPPSPSPGCRCPKEGEGRGGVGEERVGRGGLSGRDEVREKNLWRKRGILACEPFKRRACKNLFSHAAS